MQLFPENPYLEGVDCINACFGASSALFSAVDYVKLHGKLAIVVATDVAVYGGPV
jgi:hydroxymethylglutaryl-CoA synthase